MKVAELVGQLGAYNAMVEEAIAGARRGDLPAVLRLYQQIDDVYDAIDKHRKALHALVEGMSRGTIPEMFEEADVRTVTLDDIGRRFTKNMRINFSILEGMKDEAFAWIRARGDEALIQETVNAGTLSTYGKTLMEEEGVELPTDYFKMSTLVYTSSTKVAPKKEKK